MEEISNSLPNTFGNRNFLWVEEIVFLLAGNTQDKPGASYSARKQENAHTHTHIHTHTYICVCVLHANVNVYVCCICIHVYVYL